MKPRSKVGAYERVRCTHRGAFSYQLQVSSGRYGRCERLGAFGAECERQHTADLGPAGAPSTLDSRR
ncbi:unnamed protein product, partial [Iphiclides podalirius]